MAALFAALTSDPNLMRCALTRLRGLRLEDASADAAGVGHFAGTEILLQRFGSARTLPQLLPTQETAALVYHAGKLPVGASLEGHTQPFRLRHWLFAHQGVVPGFEAACGRARASLPSSLQRQLQGESDSELAFALFLKLLRESGQGDEGALTAAHAGHMLGRTARVMEQFAAEAGATRSATLNFVATNGQILIATRHGDAPLFYALLEGTDRCEVCGISPRTPESLPLVRAHRQLRAVAVSSQVEGNGWLELPADHVLEVERNLSVRLARL